MSDIVYENVTMNNNNQYNTASRENQNIVLQI